MLANFTNGGTLTEAKSKAFHQELTARGVTVFDVGINRSVLKKDNLDAYKVIKRIMDKENYAFIHCHSPIGAVMARLAFSGPIAKQEQRSFIRRMGFISLMVHPTRIGSSSIQSKKVGALYGSPVDDKRRRLSNFPDKNFKAGKIEWINGIGIDTGRFAKPSEETKDRLRKEYGFAEDDFILYLRCRIERQ